MNITIKSTIRGNATPPVTIIIGVGDTSFKKQMIIPIKDAIQTARVP